MHHFGRGVIVASGPDAPTRPARCANGHQWEQAGELNWNPWGSPDWSAVGNLNCPDCGHPATSIASRDEADSWRANPPTPTAL